MMIQRTQIILDHEDIFAAIKTHIVNQTYGVSAGDVCNFTVTFENEKPLITVNIGDKRIKSDGL